MSVWEEVIVCRCPAQAVVFLLIEEHGTQNFLCLILSRWLGATLTVLFMMCVTTILLNILIAQLSLTYEMVQEESLHSFTALRMQAVATIEWQSRFQFWVSIMTDS